MSQAKKITTTLSRRSALAGLAGTAAAGIAPAIAGATKGDDAELLALAVRFDPLFDEWVRQKKASRACRDEFNERLQRATGLTRAAAPEINWNDPAWIAYNDTMMQVSRAPDRVPWDSASWERLTREIYPVADEILTFDAETIDGIKLQVRAVMTACDEETLLIRWDDEPDDPAMGNFIQSVCAFTGVPFPPF